MGPPDRPAGTHRLAPCGVRQEQRPSPLFFRPLRTQLRRDRKAPSGASDLGRQLGVLIFQQLIAAICDKPLRCLTTPCKLRRLVGIDAKDGIAAGGGRTDRDVARSVRRRAVTAGVGVRTRHSLLRIYGGQSDSVQYLCYPLSVSLHQ